MLHERADDPTHDEATSVLNLWPPLSGLGSDKEACLAFAREVVKNNEEAWELVGEQATLIASLVTSIDKWRPFLIDKWRALAS